MSFPGGQPSSWGNECHNDAFKNPSSKPSITKLPRPRSRGAISGLSKLFEQDKPKTLHRVDASADSMDYYIDDVEDSYSSNIPGITRTPSRRVTDHFDQDGGANTTSWDSDTPIDDLIHHLNKDTGMLGVEIDEHEMTPGPQKPAAYGLSSLRSSVGSQTTRSLTRATHCSSHSISFSGSYEDTSVQCISREAGAHLPFERSLQSASQELGIFGSPKESMLSPHAVSKAGIVLSPGGINFDNMRVDTQEEGAVRLQKPTPTTKGSGGVPFFRE